MIRKPVLVASFIALGCVAAAADDVTLCTGSESGVYYSAGATIAQMAGKTFKVHVIETGGTIDNLERMVDLPKGAEGACDAMIGQPDGPVYVTRKSPAKAKKIRQIGSLHREYLHVLCNAESGIDDLGDIADGGGSLAIGEQGSGAWLIWQNILAEDDSYSGVPVTNEGSRLALSAVSTNTTTCMLVPSGPGNGLIIEADQTYGDTVILASANDKDFNDAKDILGKPLYSYDFDVPTDKYPNTFDRGWSDIETISWSAGVYVNLDKVSGKDLERLIEAVGRASVGIKAEYGK